MENNSRRHNRRKLLIRYFNALEKNIPPAEIENKWNNLMQRMDEVDHSNQFRISFYVKVACIAALLSGVIWLSFRVFTDNTEQFESVIAQLDRQPVDTVRQIVLLTHTHEQISVDKNAVVTHSKEGGVYINQKKIKLNTQKTGFNQLIVPKGKNTRLILADGSALHVNAGTKVVYPNQFTEDKREIYIDGEVLLEVAHNEQKPFIVKTSMFDVEVLGTVFNVNAYKETGTAEVVLLQGSVVVADQNQTKTQLAPNELLDIENGIAKTKRVVNTEDYTAWTQGRLPLAGKKIKDILYKLSLFYDVKMDYDLSIKKYPLYGTIDLSVSLEKVLERISKTIPIRYKETEKGYYLFMKQDVEPLN